MDKGLLKQQIQNAFAGFKTALQQHADINKKRSDGGWSVGQIADHILKGTDTNLGSTRKTERPYDKNAGSIRELFLDFGKKFSTAPDLEPDVKLYIKEDLIESLQQALQNVIQMIDKEDLTETCIDWELPGWGNLTKYECVILFENHTIRHTKQVNDFNTVIAKPKSNVYER